MKTYNVLSKILHDGKVYLAGDTIDLTDKEAEQLKEAQAIDPESIGDVKDGPTVPTDPAERQAAIVAAIGQIDTKNADLWLTSGKPNAAAITAITGWNVSAGERDAAWESIQK